MEGIELISREEQEFIQLYYTKIRNLQKDSEKIVYTKIPMAYAILNKLSLSNIVFHPISLSYSEPEQPLIPSFEGIKQTIQDIIEYELFTEENVLSREELDLLIKHYANI